MDHEILKAKIYEFHDGELDGDEAREIRGHLTACSECRAALDLWKGAVRGYFIRPDVAVPANFVQNVMAKIEEKESSPAASLWRWLALPKWEVACALSASLFIFSYFSLHFLGSLESGSNSVAMMYAHAGSESFLLSKNNLNKEDLLAMAVDEGALESESEVIYE